VTIEVIGAGFGRTGTMSLKVALERLGYVKCYHMIEVFEHQDHIPLWAAAHRGESVDWDMLYEGYSATVDWPSCDRWQEHAAHFPDARIILSTRDPERWYESVMSTIYQTGAALRDSEDENLQRFGRWADEIIWTGVFDGRFEDKDHAIAVFNAHEARVKASVPADRLLVFEASEGWQPLCEFLGKEVPDEDYPRVNTRDEFLTGSDERRERIEGGGE
jgi:hypothetical protein